MSDTLDVFAGAMKPASNPAPAPAAQNSNAAPQPASNANNSAAPNNNGTAEELRTEAEKFVNWLREK